MHSIYSATVSLTDSVYPLYWQSMADFIKLILVFFLIVIGIRRKIFVGYVLFGAGLLTAILYRLNVVTILEGYRDVLFSERLISLYGIIVLITFLGRILKEIGYLDKLVEASENLTGGARTAAAVLPALVGLMPMPGGALLSAPLVGKVLTEDKYSPAFKTVVNYWSRHVMEFCWPVYPGLILAATLTSVPLGTMCLMQMPMTLLMIPIGIIVLIRKIDINNRGKGRLLKPLLKILSAIWPILLAISIAAIFSTNLLYAVAISLTVLLIIERPKWANIREAGKSAISYRLPMLVFGVLSFQTMLELTGAVGSIPQLSTALGLPDELVIIAVSLTAGLLTGILFALVGLAYPLLAGYLYQPDINLANIFLAFISGYVGMIFSPTHFCLILTNEHFKSNLGQVYHLLAKPLVILFIGGLVLYLAGYPWNLF
jgi:integral membrane protein (TIGR00529 family)